MESSLLFLFFPWAPEASSCAEEEAAGAAPPQPEEEEEKEELLFLGSPWENDLLRFDDGGRQPGRNGGGRGPGRADSCRTILDTSKIAWEFCFGFGSICEDR